MDSKRRPSQGKITNFIEHSNAVYEYDPKDPNICRRYKVENLPRQNGRQISTSCSKEHKITDSDSALAIDEHLLCSMSPLPPPVSGMSHQQDLFSPMIDNRVKEQEQSSISTYEELKNLNTRSLSNSSESSNRPNQCHHQCHPTMTNLSSPHEMLLNQEQIRANSETGTPNQYTTPSIAARIPVVYQLVYNPYPPVAGKGRSQQIPADSVHQPQQTSPSEPREHAGTDAPTSSGPSDLRTIYSSDPLWNAVIYLFMVIKKGSLLLFSLGCKGSTHIEKDDRAAASFCRDLYIKFKKEGRLVIEDDSVYALLLNHIPLVKGWLQKALNPNRMRSGKIPKNTKELGELYNCVKEESLPLERDGPLPEPIAKMIMERGKAYDESERGKKRTGNKNEHFEQQDKRFKALGEEVDKEFDLLKHELFIVNSKREALKEGPNVVMDKIDECVKHIQKNWDGVQPVDKEPTHSGRSATKAFKKRQDVCAEAAKNEPRVKQLLDLIRHLRELLSREKCRLTDPEGNPAPDSASKLNEDSERCLDDSEDLFDPKVNVPDVMQPSAPPRELPETTPPCAFEAIHSFDPSSSTVPQTETPFVSEKACNVPLDRKRILDNELNNREGEGKRFKVNEAVRHQPPSAEVRLQNQVWSFRPSQQHIVGYQNFGHQHSYASPVNNLTGSMPHYNWESPGAPSASPIASANQFQTNRTVSQQPSGQPNPNIGGISSEPGYQSSRTDLVPQFSPYDDSQVDWTPTVPIAEQSGKQSSDQPSTESKIETTDPDQPSCSSTKSAQFTAPEQPPPQGIHDVTFDSLPIGTDGYIDFLEPK